MAIITDKTGRRYQEQCPACCGFHLYEQKAGGIADTERYICPDCGDKSVAPVLVLLAEPVSLSSTSGKEV